MDAILITGSICLSTLLEKAKEGHSAFSRSSKDGRIYFNYAEFINQEPNEYGQHSSILLSPSKDKKESEGKVYIGNGKKWENKPVTKSDVPGSGDFSNIPVREIKRTTVTNEQPIDDLPF
jgi:hypothetical protein